MTDPTPGDGTPFARAHRTLAIALLSAPLYILVALWFAAPPADEDLPTWFAGLAIVAVLLGWLLAHTVGYRVAPLVLGDDVSVATGRYQQSMLVRFVLTEVPVILGVAATFVLPYGVWTYVVVLVIGLPSMFFHVWPTRRAVNKVASRLEAGGVPSGLREVFGHR